MDLSSVFQWWEEWQLRVLVLGSLCIQCYLAFFAASRKYHIRPLFRFFIWLAYLGGDALAIYALATLFNRQKRLQYDSVNGGHDIELLWAPILLIHLGGQLGMSAYNMEDNELWRRHIVTAVSQVTIALYVFCKSWSSMADKRLSAAGVVLFILGVIKCFEKPIALKIASFNILVRSFYPAPRTEGTSQEVSLEEFIHEARHSVREDQPTLNLYEKWSHISRLIESDKLFVDLTYAYPVRLTKLTSFWLLDREAAYQALCEGISSTFDLIYTKFWDTDVDYRQTPEFWGSICAILLCPFTILLPIVPIGLFHSSHKEAYRASDIMITFVLLYITYLLEIVSWLMMAVFDGEWSEMVAQHSLIGFFASNKRHTRLMRIAGLFGCEGMLEHFFCLKPCNSSKVITSLVRSHVKSGWINYIRDIESYWKFSDIRGHWSFQRKGCEEIFRGSVEKPFDESVILWHLATDFCFHSQGAPPDSEYAELCKQISYYMIHLLFANPEMLMPGSRSSLFTLAYNVIEAILEGDDPPLLDEKELTQKIIDKAESTEGFIHDAWVLAHGLMKIGNEQEMWEVIRDVWTEMLCFSASRCRGYLHAKSLGSGGEYLTFVSLLMSHAGLETFPERQQRMQLRLPKEARLHILRIRTMKEEIIEAVRKRKERVDAAKERTKEAGRKEAAGASPEIEVVVSK